MIKSPLNSPRNGHGPTVNTYLVIAIQPAYRRIGRIYRHTSRGLYPLLCDVTADTENTASCIVACWTVFTELLPGNALIKFVAIHLILCT
jgi:hypothetical protein